METKKKRWGMIVGGVLWALFVFGAYMPYLHSPIYTLSMIMWLIAPLFAIKFFKWLLKGLF